MANSTNLQLPFLEAAQAQKHVTVNDGLQALDAIVQLSVKDRDLTAPPGSPTDGERYIVGPSATGAWASQDKNIAAFQDGVWRFYNPREGWRCWVEDEGIPLVFDSSDWMISSSAGALTSVTDAYALIDSDNNSTANKFVVAKDNGTAASATQILTVSEGGDVDLQIAGARFSGSNATAGALLNEAAAGANPTLIPNKADPNTGIGSGAADSLSFVTGGIKVGEIATTGMEVSVDAADVLTLTRASTTSPTQILMDNDCKNFLSPVGEVKFQAHDSASANFLYAKAKGLIVKETSGAAYGGFAIDLAYNGSDADSTLANKAEFLVWSGGGFPPPALLLDLPISTVGEIGYFAFRGKDNAGNTSQNYGSMRWSIVSNTSGSESGQIEIRALQAGADRSFKFQDGAQFGAPTGGFKGNGTLNAVAVYDDNVLLTCYGFAQANEGVVDPAEWDGYAAEDKDGSRNHQPAKDFIARQADVDQTNPDQYASYWKSNGHFPNLPGRSPKYDHGRDKLSVGQCGQKLIEICEMQAIHIEKLNQRLKVLEGK